MRSTCRCWARRGSRELGELILQQAHYAAQRSAGSRASRILFPSGFFKEFVVNFDETGKTVRAINKALRRRGIFGGKDLSARIPGARPERALLRHRDPHPGRHRPPRRGAQGGGRR